MDEYRGGQVRNEVFSRTRTRRLRGRSRRTRSSYFLDFDIATRKVLNFD